MRNWMLTIGVFFLTLGTIHSQSVIGKWKTIDDETGEAKSIVEIYEKSGILYGKVVAILRANHKKDICTECEGAEKNKHILGMVIISGLKKEDSEYKGGTILDPTNGKKYKCYITLDSPDKLKVRGFVGISIMGRTQYWTRVKK